MRYISKLFLNSLIISKKAMTLTRVLLTFLLICCYIGALTGQKPAKTYARKPVVERYNNMVVTAHPEATKIGVKVLADGGNAVDAAVAVHFALAVCYPTAGNIGGGGFTLYRNKDGAFDVLDYREVAPAKASKNMFLDSAGNVIKDLSLKGALAAGVPGSVDGMWELHKKYGSTNWNKLIQPAIDLARNGFRITAQQASEFNKHQDDFDKHSTRNYLKHNKFTDMPWKANPWSEGNTLKIPHLANTLEAIRDKGRDGFYTGWVADSIVAQMNRSGGIITHQDLANYKTEWRVPLKGTYRGYTVTTMPPPSAGGIALLQILKMLEPFDLAARGFNKAITVNLMAEAEKLAYADRSKYIGDPQYISIPTDTLLDEAYLRQRFFTLQCCRANPAETIKPGTFSWPESEETTHFSITDQYGNAIAITTTINSPYGSHLFVSGCGFILNNEMDDFSTKPGALNSYNLPGSKANSIAPGKRMVSSMTPTMVEKDGKLYLVVGTPGGSTIITSVLQTIVNVIDHKMDMQSAVDAPRFHHQWLPDVLYYEKGAFSKKQLYMLKALGYKTQEREPIGRVDAIMLKDSKFIGGADSRGDDNADGVNDGTEFDE
jgi:gamma-glutamyltranspeptidase / glutathione hydrolase